MNAYELADQLDNVKYQNGAKPFEMYANMLRQQADRIDKLERETVAKNNYLEQHCQKIDQQADRIAELEKQGEPVAWMEYIQGEEWEVWYTEPTDLPEGHSYKPLYLAPQSKPLSDEEIYALWCEADNTELLPEMRLKDGSINYIITTFAKLIEERHGIK